MFGYFSWLLPTPAKGPLSACGSVWNTGGDVVGRARLWVMSLDQDGN